MNIYMYIYIYIRPRCAWRSLFLISTDLLRTRLVILTTVVHQGYHGATDTNRCNHNCRSGSYMLRVVFHSKNPRAWENEGRDACDKKICVRKNPFWRAKCMETYRFSHVFSRVLVRVLAGIKKENSFFLLKRQQEPEQAPTQNNAKHYRFCYILNWQGGFLLWKTTRNKFDPDPILTTAAICIMAPW